MGGLLGLLGNVLHRLCPVDPKTTSPGLAGIRYARRVADRDELQALVGRLADRLGMMSLTRLAAAVEGYESRAKAAYMLAARLAEFAQGVEEAARPTPPDWRELPWVADTVVAHQLMVVGADLVAALLDASDESSVWTRTGRRTTAEALAATVTDVRRIKRLVE
jgi:hypothetical protein